jgi:hypothetical protein
MKSAVVVALTSALLVASGNVAAQSEDDAGLEHLVIEMATTSGQHHAVANHYAAKAEEARREMRRHEAMAQAYMLGRTPRPQLRDHCLKIAKSEGDIAAEYDELAKLHEQEAGNAPQ